MCRESERERERGRNKKRLGVLLQYFALDENASSQLTLHQCQSLYYTFMSRWVESSVTTSIHPGGAGCHSSTTAHSIQATLTLPTVLLLKEDINRLLMSFPTTSYGPCQPGSFVLHWRPLQRPVLGAWVAPASIVVCIWSRKATGCPPEMTRNANRRKARKGMRSAGKIEKARAGQPDSPVDHMPAPVLFIAQNLQILGYADMLRLSPCFSILSTNKLF